MLKKEGRVSILGTWKDTCAWRGMECGDCFKIHGNPVPPPCYDAIAVEREVKNVNKGGS